MGHELSQSVNVERDAKLKRMQFISKSTDIREMFDFAHPTQVLETVSIYIVHFYGVMLWDLYGKEAGKVYRSWNTCVKLAWQVPRSTHTYLVENLLALELPSVKQKLLCQYVGFFKKIRSSCSKEVRILSEIVARDAQTVTGRNP